MLAFIGEQVRSIDSSVDKHIHSVQFDAEFARAMSWMTPNEISVFMFIALTANEAGIAAAKPVEIKERIKSITLEEVVRAMNSLGRMRIENRRVMFMGKDDHSGGLFQIIMPTDDELNRLSRQRVRDAQIQFDQPTDKTGWHGLAGTTVGG